MKMRRGVLQGAWVLTAVCGALLPSAPVLAQAPAAEVVQAGNRIEKIIAAEQGGNVILKLTLAASACCRAIPCRWSCWR